MVNLTDFVRENYNLGGLREQISGFVTHTDYADIDLLPRDDQLCAMEINEAMELYFRLRNEKYEEKTVLDHPFIRFIRENARCTSLREQLGYYIDSQLEIAEDDFPRDSSTCRSVISLGIRIHLDMKRN